MKNIIYLVSIVLIFVSCKEEILKDFVTISGKITNPSSDSLVVIQSGIIKSIKVNNDGTFSDTLKITPGNYILFDGKQQANIYLKNGFDLNITLDTNAFSESISYEGPGEDVNNYLANKVLFRDNLLESDELMRANKADFDNKVSANIKAFKTSLQRVPDLDSTFVVNEEKSFAIIVKQLESVYNKNHKAIVLKGEVSPEFNNYENYTGGNISLDDLKGKYVYIDLWATWCGPCKAEIPFLKKVEKAYHNKNIEFVSISLDRANAYQTWRTMVEEKELTGIQLYAKGDQKFARDYNVSSIPRFILIDPNGHIVNANAPRPSNNKLIELFEKLSI